MKKIRIAVCDDEKSVLDIVKGATINIFTSLNQEVEIDCYSSSKTLLHNYKKMSYQLFLLDIDLPELDGITMASRIRQDNKDAQIVFVSGREEKVFDSFAVRPLGFVRKSNFVKDMSEVAARFLEVSVPDKRQTRMIEFTSNRQVVTLDIDKVKYIESYRNKKIIYTIDDRTDSTVYTTMDVLEEFLNQYGFIRIQKGYLVNYKCIRRFEGEDCILVSGESLPVSRHRKKEVISIYLALLKEDDAIIL